jgi:hypothetical protein
VRAHKREIYLPDEFAVPRDRRLYPFPHYLDEPGRLADLDTAARKLIEIANAVDAVQDGRIFIELINGSFLKDGGTPDQYRVASHERSSWVAVAA